MRPSAAIAVSAALSVFASSFIVWQVAVLLFRVAPGLGAEPRIIAGVLVQAGLAAWGFANAVGLSRRRRRARISVLFFAGVLILWSVAGSLGALAALANLPAGSLKTMGTFAELLPRAAMVLAGIWWLVVLNRQSLRSAFSSHAER